jgi:hypothetical protein
MAWLFAGSSAILALAAAFLLYREALGLPFLFDDMIHLRWLDWHSLSAIWTTAEGLGYYRPLTMSIWKIAHLWMGRYDPASFHLLNLLVHALNAFLASCIAWRAWPGKGRLAYALLVTAIFVSFPFSYQAVPSTSSLSKPLIATLTLGSALLYWQARRQRTTWLLGLSLLLGLLAPFAYESGVMVPAAIVAVEILGYTRREFDRLSWLPLLYMVLIWGGALPLIVHMEPDTGASLRLPSLLTLWQNGVYFVQGLIFPLAPLGSPLARLLPIDEYLLVAILGLLGLALLFAFYRWVGQIRLLLYALSWFAVGVLPLWLMLDFSYVITSPRLLYLGAVGSALVWAGIPVFLWAKLPARWALRLLAVASVVAVLGFNTVYVRDKMDLARTASAPLWQAARAAEAWGPSSRLLYLNVPAWIAPKKPTYQIGTEGLTFIPDYVRPQDFVYVTTGVEPKIRSFMFDPAKQDWSAYIGYAGTALDWPDLAKQIRRVDAVYRTAYSSTGLSFLEAGAIQARATPEQTAALARFGNQILLQDCQAQVAGSQITLHLWWYSLQVPDHDVTVFVHVYDSAGQLITQVDGYPLLGLSPPQSWQQGDLVHDIRYITLPPGAAQGGYRIVAGWYDPATGERLPALDSQGQPVADNAIQVLP